MKAEELKVVLNALEKNFPSQPIRNEMLAKEDEYNWFGRIFNAD